MEDHDFSLFTRRRPGQPTIPDVVLNDPNNRRLKVITVGAGLAGIMNAYNIQKECKNIEHVIFDKNGDLGGTWYENRYPGVACDVPSHSYAYHFAPNADWPGFLSSGQDIWDYLNRVVKVFGLRKYMRFNVEVVGAYWEESISKWKVKIRDNSLPYDEAESEEYCDVLLYATGLLNKWKWPDVKGRELFEGRVIHTANWPQEYKQKQWKDQRIAVIGSGASSIQVVPSMQPYVKQIEVFVRTAVWFVTLVDGFSQGYVYTEAEKERFRQEPQELVKHTKFLENQLNNKWESFFLGSMHQEYAQKKFRARMKGLIQDERLYKGFTPKWSFGCRRVTPGDPYLRAIQKPNVNVNFTAVSEITPTGVVGADGKHREVDTIICATGFDVSFTPRFPIIGRNGISLSEKWHEKPLAYFGLTIPDMPNFMIHGGPPSPLQNGSPLGFFHAVGDYAIQIIKKLQKEDIKSLEPKKDVTRSFGKHCQDWIKESVFSDECNSWYKDKNGEIHTIYPGSVLHYSEMIKNARWEDYHIQYRDPINMWSFMGNGFSVIEKTPKADLSPYIREDKIDPKWVEELKSRKQNKNKGNGVPIALGKALVNGR